MANNPYLNEYGNTWTPQGIRDYVVSQGLVSGDGTINDPRGIYEAARRYGVTADQLDNAGSQFGWTPGTANNWIQQQGLNPLTGQPVGISAATRTAAGITAPPQAPPPMQPTSSPASQPVQQPATTAAPNPYLQGSQGGAAGPTGGSYSPTQGQPGGTSGQTGYGYGQGPGSSNRGYYEQQTPVGSFAAADVNRANASTTSNPYIGQNSERSADPGRNAYAGANPYLEGSIAGTIRSATQAFNDVVNPQFDRMAQASGSFGNTGVEAARGRAQQEFGTNLANTVGNMRMQDYTQQQGLDESRLNRTLNNSQFNSLRSEGDIGRNSTLAQNEGMFNAGALNTNSMFNAGAGNQNSMFNAGSANTMLGQIRGINESARQFDTGLASNNRQFDRTMGQREHEFNTNQGNWETNFDYTTARNALFDPMQLRTMDMNLQRAGLDIATIQDMAPLQKYEILSRIGANLGGMGGSNSQNMQGNPWLGALGGALTGINLYNNWGR